MIHKSLYCILVIGTLVVGPCIPGAMAFPCGPAANCFGPIAVQPLPRVAPIVRDCFPSALFPPPPPLVDPIVACALPSFCAPMMPPPMKVRPQPQGAPLPRTYTVPMEPGDYRPMQQ
ncbi:MAG: hypothetical protein V1792_12300 [Pseudomonadota bacterium]